MLQLLPQRWDNVNGNWNLATDSKFQSMIKNIDDFEIKIETKTLTEINNMNKGEMKKLLSEKQMLVIGIFQIRMDRYRIFWILLNQVRVLFFHMIRHLILIMTRMICMKK